MKKLITLMTVLMCALFMGLTAHAQDVLYTDIGTYINNYPISGYGVDGKIVVVAEDLRDYGFDVEWNGAARTLNISRNNASVIYRRDVYKPVQASGTKFSDIYASDIKVYANGMQIPSYALNGYTLVPINDLAAIFGKESYDNGMRKYVMWLDGIKIGEFLPTEPRVKNYFYGQKSYLNFDIIEDMNTDGVNDSIKVRTTSGYDRYSIGLELSANGHTSKNILKNLYCYEILAVYTTDLIPNDHAREIVIFGNCESDDPCIIIYRYQNGNFKELNFKFNNDQTIKDNYFVGYNSNSNFPFIQNDDGSFTTLVRTNSRGMWSVYRTFKPTSEYIIEEVKQDVFYDLVIPNWLNANKWGYYRVDQTYTSGGFKLYAGDYIKILADDDNNHILLQKSNGEQGWFTLSWSLPFEVSSLFRMAG